MDLNIVQINHSTSYNEILPGLWLGDKASSHNTDFLSAKKIQCIINCTLDLPFINDKNIVKKRIPVNDDLSYESNEVMIKFLNNTIDLIQKNMLQNKNTLVHCYAGKQRSATVIACYLIKYGRIKRESVYDLIRTKRPEAFMPGVNFEYAINSFIKKIKRCK